MTLMRNMQELYGKEGGEQGLGNQRCRRRKNMGSVEVWRQFSVLSTKKKKAAPKLARNSISALEPDNWRHLRSHMST